MISVCGTSCHDTIVGQEPCVGLSYLGAIGITVNPLGREGSTESTGGYVVHGTDKRRCFGGWSSDRARVWSVVHVW
jgi:hypothetical protein